MLRRAKLAVFFALLPFTVPASADPIVYALTSTQRFGTFDLGTGTFRPIGPNTPEPGFGLFPGPNGSLLTLTASGNLDSINPATGVTSVIGATGLDDCSTPASPCGPTSVGTFGMLGGTFYAMDFKSDLYTINPATGAATLIGHTGIPSVTAVPLSTNPDGSFNFYDGNLFASGGKLYANFDAGTFNPASFVITTLIPAALYQIDPSTGFTTRIAPTSFGLSAAVNVNGTIYAFDAGNSQVVTLDLTNGSTSFVSNVDPAAGLIYGASPVPEPASVTLVGIGIAGIAVGRLRRRHG